MAFPTSSGSSVEQYSRIFAGVKVRGFEALVDTAAEDGVIGDKALKQMTEELKKFHLQPVDVKTQGALPCAGIGGAATIVKTVDLPTSVAGQQGVLRMTVLKDSETFSTPPLLPISYLEAVKAIIDLSTEELRLPDGFKTPMYRLSSGHRAVDILQFQEQPWLLPDEFLVDGKDPFRLPEFSLRSASTSLWTIGPDTVCTPAEACSTASCASDGPGVKVFVHLLNGQVQFAGIRPGWHYGPVTPADCALHGRFCLAGDRYAMVLDEHGHFMHVRDQWQHPRTDLQYAWRGRVFFYEAPVTSTDTAGSTLAHSGAPPDDRDSAFDFGGGGNLGRSVGGNLGRSVGAVGSFGGSVGLLSGAVRRSGGRRKSRDCQLAWIEARAKQLCEASNFSEDGMVQLAKMLEGNKNYRNILRKQTKQGHTVVLGAFVHGGVCGITSLTLRMPETCRFVNSWLCHHAGRAFGRWSSVHIGVQVRAPPHIDKNNEPQSQNLTITAGDFRGGELWLASNTKGGGNTEVGKVVNGKRRVGYLIDTRMKPLVFRPKMSTCLGQLVRLSSISHRLHGQRSLEVECTPP